MSDKELAKVLRQMAVAVHLGEKRPEDLGVVAALNIDQILSALERKVRKP